MNAERPTFVIGDVHGRADLLAKLLTKAEIIDNAGMIRRDDVQVVQVGDLVDLGKHSTDEADGAALVLARMFNMVCLWGNHERGYVDPEHTFTTLRPVKLEMATAVLKVNRLLAVAAHGYLITHAGVNTLYGDIPADPVLAAAAINESPWAAPVVHDIGFRRGGTSAEGGILWRDDNHESLSLAFPQIYGHTAGLIRPSLQRWDIDTDERTYSYCVDADSKKSGRLAGIWLPSLRVVAVGNDVDAVEMSART